MVDVGTIALVGAVAVGGYLFLKSSGAAEQGLGGIGINLPNINLPSFALTLPSFDFSGLGDAMGKMVGSLGSGITGFGTEIGKGLAAMGTGLGSGIYNLGSNVAGQAANVANNAVNKIGDAASNITKPIGNAINTATKVVGLGAASAVGAGIGYGATASSITAGLGGITAVGGSALGAIAGAGVPIAAFAGWELGSSSRNPIANAIKGVVGYSQNMLYSITNIATGNVISSFGASSLDRAKKLMSQAYGANWAQGYRIVVSGKA